MTFHTIACCTDFSKNADVAVQTAALLAKKFDAVLEILHVVPPPVNPVVTDFDNPVFTSVTFDDTVDGNIVLHVEEKLQKHYASTIPGGVKARYVVLDGHVSTEILNHLEESGCDLVVLGSYGLSGMGLVLFGSIAKRVAHKAICSVMIARSADASV
ncbi:universal stress protein [Desulfoluna sp.]|uniref:universal stress protein n=1 Tax=Desulfoluna sp. TaxID=2045199 RepID=UPI00260B7747|nr:universal stress protein [Desulfoluna sp.]